MNTSRIRGFLLQIPRPNTIRCHGEGEPEEIKVGRNAARCAETIAALTPDLIEALDEKGKIIRATRLGSAEAQRSDAADIPEGLKADPQALMLTHFANLLHRAYEHSTEIAFTKMVEFADRMNDRAENIEKRLERAESDARRVVQDSLDDERERLEEEREKVENGEKEGDGGLLNQMATAFVSGQLQSKVAGVSKPNGKGGS